MVGWQLRAILRGGSHPSIVERSVPGNEQSVGILADAQLPRSEPVITRPADEPSVAESSAAKPAELVEYVVSDPPPDRPPSELAETANNETSAQASLAIPALLSKSGVKWADASARSAEMSLLEEARAAIAHDPESAAARRTEFRALLALNRFDEALQSISDLIELTPDDPKMLFERAALLIRQRDWIAAADALQSVLDREPEHSAALYNLATVYTWLGRLNDAQRTWSAYIAQAPSDLDARFRRGEISLDLNEPAQAVSDFQFVLAVYPEPDRKWDAAVANLSLALQRACRFDEARTLTKEVLSRHPETVPALERLARLNLAEVDHFDAASESDPASNLAAATALLNDTESACERAVELVGLRPVWIEIKQQIAIRRERFGLAGESR